jgi:hypothetical protein
MRRGAPPSPRVALGRPILERAYTTGRSRRAVVTLRIGRPRFGIDAFQSLVLALEYARLNLTIPDRGLRFLGSPAGADFPIYPVSRRRAS